LHQTPSRIISIALPERELKINNRLQQR
jgi:hypothetical protein